MSAITTIRQGEDLEFIFDLDGEDITGWICTIFVKMFLDDPPVISRVIPPTNNNTWEGFLTSTETAALADSSKSPYYLTAILTNSGVDQERQIPRRFNVKGAWA